MSTLSDLHRFSLDLPRQEKRTPLLFIGHGSPMNGIEHNRFSQTWQQKGRELPRPRAILVISAHWLTRGTRVTAMEAPKTIHDFGGFPEALYQVQYPAPGLPSLAEETRQLVSSIAIEPDHDWGLDHGAWTVLRQMFPDASIPVLQLSIDYHQPAAWHYALGRELQSLRNKGVLVIGSGNMIHNLRMVAWDRLNEPGFGYDWAQEMHTLLRNKLTEGDHPSLIDYEKLGPAARLAIPTPDHYYPLLYVLGMQDKSEVPQFFNDELVGGSLNMTSVQWGVV
jgi:4,5-DOPA dioxygenase extradiol